MMHSFLLDHRDELIARCKQKVALRPGRAATDRQLANGVPLFLDQLSRTLYAEETGGEAESLRISGASGGDALALSEIGVSANVHGGALHYLGFSIDQVVHAYGDLCQAITDLAFEREAPFSIDEFRTLNRCLDNAIADAVTAFSFQNDRVNANQQSSDARERTGALVHELRNALSTALLSFAALERGDLPLRGATGAALKRALASLNSLINRALVDVQNESPGDRETFSVTDLITDAKDTAELDAHAGGCALTVATVDAGLVVSANRELLLAALGNLLQNAFRYSHPHSEITLKALSFGPDVLIEVHDHCGGLPPGLAEQMFTPFHRRSDDRSGLGLGLSIARRSVEDDLGTLTVRDVPGTGCVFTISLPRHALQSQQHAGGLRAAGRRERRERRGGAQGELN